MTPRVLAPLALIAALAALPACSDTAEPEAESSAAADPLAGLAIKAVKAAGVSNVPLGTVPGTITLPPEARVAVTAPFPGAAVRVYVIEGQAVRRGQPLALVRSAEPVQIRGDLSRGPHEGDARAHRHLSPPAAPAVEPADRRVRRNLRSACWRRSPGWTCHTPSLEPAAPARTAVPAEELLPPDAADSVGSADPAVPGLAV